MRGRGGQAPDASATRRCRRCSCMLPLHWMGCCPLRGLIYDTDVADVQGDGRRPDLSQTGRRTVCGMLVGAGCRGLGGQTRAPLLQPRVALVGRRTRAAARRASRRATMRSPRAVASRTRRPRAAGESRAPFCSDALALPVRVAVTTPGIQGAHQRAKARSAAFGAPPGPRPPGRLAGRSQRDAARRLPRPTWAA